MENIIDFIIHTPQNLAPLVEWINSFEINIGGMNLNILSILGVSIIAVLGILLVVKVVRLVVGG